MRHAHRPIASPTIAVLLAVSLVLPGAPTVAQVNPTLTAQSQGIKDGQTEAERTALHFAEMRVGLRVRGRVADVTINATIANRSNDLNEASFALTLPDDAVVTGYALDIGGRMIDGQLVEQPKARNVFEDEVRGRIDPGLAEMAAANRFVTRVYPLPRGGARSIRVSFAAPFDPDRGLVLPLGTERAIGAFSVDADIRGYRKAPAIRVGSAPLALARDGEGWRGSMALKDHVAQGGIAASGGTLAAPMLVSRHRNGRAFFQIVDAGPVAAPPAKGGRLRVYWDRSLSRRDDLLAREIGLLAAYVDDVKPVAVDLVTYAGDVPEVTTLPGSAAAVRAALSRQVYRGGTRLAGLDGLQLPAPTQCLMFTDGLATIDPEAEFRPDCRLTIVASAPDAGGARLGRLAQRSGGQLLRLTEANSHDLLARLRRPAVTVAAALDNSGRPLDFRALPAANGSWFVVGEMPASGKVRLSIAGLGQGLVERSYDAPESAGDADAPGALWASQRTAEMADDPDAHARMAALARDFQIASPTMSFLVMETPDQYANAGIRPPEGFPEHWMTRYRTLQKAREQGETAAARQKFDNLLWQWNARKEWWDTRFVAPYRPRYEEDREIVVTAHRRREPVMAAPMNAVTVDASAELARSAPVPLPAPPAAQAAPAASGKRIALRGANVLADRPYLAALAGAAPGDRLRVLAEQEAEFGSLPAFYLDTSEWFRRKGDAATAEALLYSALELPTADDETRQVVAFRLQRSGQRNRAIRMLERIAATTDFRPHPKRALALALADRGRLRGAAGRADLERAFALLAEVALAPATQGSEQIGLIALTEANALIPAIDAAGGKWSLDPRLVGLVHTDVRVVMEWTSDASNLDLSVIEPSGERVYPGLGFSGMGGTMSWNVTNGYGPEEYLIRRAPSGEYRVRVQGVSGDRLNPNGTGRAMVRMIRDFGRPSARETLVDAEIDFGWRRGEYRPDAEQGLLIARMQVAPRAR